MNTFHKLEVNQLAKLFYKMHGCTVPDGYDFEDKPHPQERLMFQMARWSYEFWYARLPKSSGTGEPPRKAHGKKSSTRLQPK